MQDKYNFRIAQKAEIKDGEKFLIFKRSPDAYTYQNCWEFTGGRLEQGESPKEGLKREVKEETNLDIEVLNPKFLFAEKLKDHYVVFVVYQCNLIKGELKLSEEHVDSKWATREEILKLQTERFLTEYLTKYTVKKPTN